MFDDISEGSEEESSREPRYMGEFFAVFLLRSGKQTVVSIETITVTHAVHLARKYLDTTKLDLLCGDLFYQPAFGDSRKLASLVK